MKTELVTSHPPEPIQSLQLSERLTVRPSWLDRAAMRLGLRLLIWSTRPLPDKERERLANQQYLERAERERNALRRALLERPC